MHKCESYILDKTKIHTEGEERKEREREGGREGGTTNLFCFTAIISRTATNTSKEFSTKS